MTYFSVEDFVRNGALKGILPKLLEEGWDNVWNLKLMKSEDMDAINMTQQQKDALEMRSYLYDRALMQYGDKLEDSGKSRAKLLKLSNDDLSIQFGMKRSHIASFLEKRINCYPLQASHSLPSTQNTNTSPRYNGFPHGCPIAKPAEKPAQEFNGERESPSEPFDEQVRELNGI